MAGDGAGGSICSHPWRVLKIIIGALILVCFLSVLSIQNGVINVSDTGSTPPQPHSKHGKILVNNRRIHLGHHLIVVSKRRVPNGPDPIHNRRVGESRRPPGRA